MQQFIRDKYINKKWVENIKAGDPAWLYYNDRKKFEKYLLKLNEEGAPEEAEEEEPKKKSKKSKKSKKHQSDSEEEPEVLPTVKSHP